MYKLRKRKNKKAKAGHIYRATKVEKLWEKKKAIGTKEKISLKKIEGRFQQWYFIHCATYMPPFSFFVS